MRHTTFLLTSLLILMASSAAWGAALWTSDSGGSFPAGSFVAGRDASGDLRACRTTPQNSTATVIGFVGPGGCRAVKGTGQGFGKSAYEVLETPDPGDWVSGWTGSGVAGGTATNGSPLYVCRLLIGNDKVPGKYHAGNATCYAWPNGGVQTSATHPFETLTACSVAAEASAIPDSGDFNAGEGKVDAYIWNTKAATVKSWLSSNGYLSTSGNPVGFQPCANVPQFGMSNFHYAETKQSLRGACACQ